MAEAIVRDKTRPTTACDLCRTLTADDIPGANLTKSPSKAKKTELQFWMKCRGLKFKSVDTRAVLIDRVQSCIENEYAIIDPDPSKCYTKAKRNICLCNQNRNPTEVRPTLNEEDEADIISQVPSSGWTKEILVNKKFSFINIESHAKNSGRNLKGGQYIEKPLKKGYKFFYDNYVHSATTVLKEGICFLRAKCYRSQRKNEQPHSITIALHDEVVINAHCSCAAGAGGYCNHIIAVLYLVDHCIKMSIVEFPEIGTCTDNPQQWHRPRTEGITAEQIMEVHVIRPEYGSSMTGIKSSLYNASAKSIWDDEISGMTCTLFGDLAKINPSFGFCQVFDQTTTSFQQTKLGFHVPVGSVLSYQLSITEGDFEVFSDFSSVSTNNTPVSMTDFPILPIAPSHYQYKLSHKLSDEQAVFLKSLNYPFNKIVEIEEETQTQRECPLWFAERQFRLTASTFGNIINRKSVSDKFVKSLLTSKDISHVPAVKYGIENEQKALGKYCEYMKNIKKDIRVYHSGLVINPGFCWLAASPDGKFADKDAGYGLLEVKCPYTHRDITPKSACRDESFCSKLIDGKPKLKTSHNYFYQIQGQMGICGLEFCDFIIYTKKGMSIERVKFDREFWNLMLDKLTNFYFKHFITVVITEKSSV